MEGTLGLDASNLWAGIVMIVVAAGFALWSRLRPIAVEVPKGTGRDRRGH